MRRILRHRLVIGGVVLAFAASGGAAYAASQSGGNPRGAFLTDVAKRLNVSPQRLQSAIKGAAIDQLNAAVKDGRLTRAQANAIKQRIERNGGPPFMLGPPLPFAPSRGVFPHPPGQFGVPAPFALAPPFAAAAKYLGLSEKQLLNDLRAGHSPAQIAKTRGKSVSGLERAVTAAIKSRLDHAVAAGRITKSQEQRLLSRLSGMLGALINRTPPAPNKSLHGRVPGPWTRPAPLPPL